MARSNGAGNDVVYRVVMVHSDAYMAQCRQRNLTHVEKYYYAAGPYTTPQPAKREAKKLRDRYFNPQHPYLTNPGQVPFYEDVYVEEGKVTWSRFE